MKDIFIILFNMLNEMSPYILLGFLIAGALHVFISPRIMSRHLSGTGYGAVVKAALLGIPLPLCSCGVLPTAVALRRNGASRAASSSFLIATPQTGVDSIAATYSLLGPAFAIIRPVAALATAFFGGIAVGAAERADAADEDFTHDDCRAGVEKKSLYKKLREMLKYGFFDMVKSIGKWLILGLVIAALITIFVPEDFFVMLSSRPLLAMIAVVIVAIPMYVCATGSIPIAMSLMLKGLSPGAAFVLLMAGPAANFASMTVISRVMGRKCAAVYIGSIVLSSIMFGLIIDYLLPQEWFLNHIVQMHGACHVENVSIFNLICSISLVILLIIAMVANYYPKHKQHITMSKEYKIKGMSCAHCKATVEKNLAKLPGVTSVSVDLSKGIAFVGGEHDEKTVIETISSLGFDPIP